MSLNGVKIGFALTGSFYTLRSVISKIKELVDEGAEVIPVMSFNARDINTKYGNASDLVNEIEEITGHKVINTFVEADSLLGKNLIDILVVAPCTGNTIAKIANGISDTPVLIAVNSNLRSGNSIVLGIVANDGLSTNAANIGKLLNTKNIYFIPFRQSNPITKPNALAFDIGYTKKSVEAALKKEQIQPLLL